MQEIMLHHHRALLPLEWLKQMKQKAEEAYSQPGNVFRLLRSKSIYDLPNGGKYNKDSDSFTLDAVLGYQKSLKTIQQILDTPKLKEYLPKQYFVNLDQVWIRRQFPPQNKKSIGHQWHQDGALGYNFMETTANNTDGLLDMMIFWIPLTDCGLDAPGMEFINGRQHGILPLHALNDHTLKATYKSDQFIAPIAAPGDVLVFGGNMIHRTHKTNSMTKYRISLGIRVFAEIPKRCSHERHIEFSKITTNFDKSAT